MKTRLTVLFCSTLIVIAIGLTINASYVEAADNTILELNQDSAIVITSNEDFNDTADSGSGNLGDPWIIENKNIGAGTALISISNTNGFFILRNNNLQGGDHGIQLDNVQNGLITDNTILDNTVNGITGIDSSNIIIQDNEIYDNGGDSCPIILSLNRLTIDSHGGGAVLFDPSSNIHIIGNDIHDNALYGIILDAVTNGTIIGNTIDFNGLNSCIPILGGHGIELLNSDLINITYNNITNNDQYGLNLNGTSSDNIVKLNNFIDNTLEPQAKDVGMDNEFLNNHWS